MEKKTITIEPRDVLLVLTPTKCYLAPDPIIKIKVSTKEKSEIITINLN